MSIACWRLRRRVDRARQQRPRRPASARRSGRPGCSGRAVWRRVPRLRSRATVTSRAAIWRPSASMMKIEVAPFCHADDEDLAGRADHRVGHLRVGDEDLLGVARQVDDHRAARGQLDLAGRGAPRRRRPSSTGAGPSVEPLLRRAPASSPRPEARGRRRERRRRRAASCRAGRGRGTLSRSWAASRRLLPRDAEAHDGQGRVRMSAHRTCSACGRASAGVRHRRGCAGRATAAPTFWASVSGLGLGGRERRASRSRR